jgi:hypothetical protein
MNPQTQAALLIKSAQWHRQEAANYLRHSVAAMHQHERAAQDLERAAAKLLQLTKEITK